MNPRRKINEKMVGQLVGVQEEERWSGVVEKVIDEDTFLVKDLHSLELKSVSIFDIRSMIR
tara:strand:+ start:101 stop:283 length:183 start_codon:yes stop_codon:yes gene_type:complete